MLSVDDVVAFAPKVIKCAAYGVAQGRGGRYGWMGGRESVGL